MSGWKCDLQAYKNERTGDALTSDSAGPLRNRASLPPSVPPVARWDGLLPKYLLLYVLILALEWFSASIF